MKTAEEALRAADFSVNRSEFDLQMARARLQSARGRVAGPSRSSHPIDGVVLKRMRESESVVQAGEPLLEAGDPSRLEVVADLLSTDAVQVPAGARVLVEQWGGGHRSRGGCGESSLRVS